ncbi:MAG TPA: SH3 domain-containing protein [Xanthobacteraceae bacterium]|nr:SH3 domain-containing protein [Xanthobacteraceae bacterium]
MHIGQRYSAVFFVLAFFALAPAPAHSEDETGAVSGLPVPRFVSLKADKVNLRAGPTRDHDVTAVFTRAGLPVEITSESENWRKIRDSEGAEGWVYHSLLSSRRTVLVAPWSKKDETFPLYQSGSAGAQVTARLEHGVLASVKGCDGKWCRIFGEGFDGYMEQERLWGVYPNETVE